MEMNIQKSFHLFVNQRIEIVKHYCCQSLNTLRYEFEVFAFQDHPIIIRTVIVNYDYFHLELFSSSTWEWRELRNIRLPSYVYPVSDDTIISGCIVYFLLSDYVIL
uniref:Uncharacterized protein n=1 Tax=Lactuca sativa TaxID=4236 RepID=A0A9R1WAQ7_LACSA|nr:hypothetical protein LSAT_V11C300150730 [Lactuca sativa]